MQKPNRPNSRSGFSLMEIIVAVSILSILAAALATRAGGMIEKGKSGKIINLVSTLKTACTAYNVDTGNFAREYSGYPVAHRKLSGTQTEPGWSGPYLEGPITHAQNPYGGQMHLYDLVTAGNWISGFDVDADGTLDVTGNASMLYMNGIEESEAKSINDAIDLGLTGSWQDRGRVVYQAGSKRLLILVFY